MKIPEKERPAPVAGGVADWSAVLLLQDDMEELEDFEEDEENAIMKKIFLESKRTASIEEEQRQDAWAALGHSAPGPSRDLGHDAGLDLEESEEILTQDKEERILSQESKKADDNEKEKVKKKVLSSAKVPKEGRWDVEVSVILLIIYIVDSTGKQQGTQPQAAEVKRGRSGNRVKPKADEGKAKKVEKAAGKTVPKKKPENQDDTNKESWRHFCDCHLDLIL